MKTGAVTLAFVAAVLATVAVAAPGRQSAATKVSVRLVEFKIQPSPRAVNAGRITFVVHNAGKLRHELVVIRTSRKAGKLPLHEGEASERGAVGEISNLPPGSTKRLTLTLRSGHYALICNLPGHYTRGQYANLNVR